MTNHFARIDTHRVQVMQHEDDFCAPEGGHPHHWRNNQGDPIKPAPRKLKPPVRRINWPMWSGVIAAGLVCACALAVHLLAPVPK